MEPREVVLAYLDAMNAHDPEAACSFVGENFFNEHTATRGFSFHGKDEYRRRLPDFLARMQDLVFEVEDTVAEGSNVVVAYVMDAKFEVDGEWRPFRIRGVYRFVVEDELIVHRVDYRDGVDFEEQVGLRPAS